MNWTLWWSVSCSMISGFMLLKFRVNFAAEISRSQLGEHIFFEVNKFQKGSGLTNQNRAISIKIITNCINLHLVFRSFSLFGLFH